MKNKLLIVVCVFLIRGITSAQCNNEVSTHPFGPSNQALPDIYDGGTNSQDGRYLNRFDWINGNASISNQEYVLTNMYFNPGQPYGNMANIQDANLTDYYGYLNKHNGGGEEMNVQNGWELMLINLGRYPDDQTIITNTTLNDVPYLVFYNKFQGILRVFVQRGYNEPTPLSNNGVRIDLSYDNPSKMSGILRLAEGADRSLDQMSSVTKLTTIALKKGQSSFWISGDFQLTYDPCVCFKPSNLSLNFTFFNEQDFKLYGRGISVEESLVENGDVLDKTFLSNVDYSNVDAENGLIIYNKMEDLIDDYIKKMVEYENILMELQQANAEIEKNLKIARAVSTILKWGITGAVGSQAILALQGDLAKFFFNDASDKSKATVGKLFGELEKLLGKNLDTYVNKNFQTNEGISPPSKPSVVFSEMHFDGSLSSEQGVFGPTFNTPGSFINNPNTLDFPYGGSVYGYPVYNNPVGVFALLEKPVVRMSKTRIQSLQHRNNIPMPPVSESPDHDYWIYHYTRNYAYQEWTNEYQYQLVNDLKYTFNQALDIKEYSISAAFVFEPEFKYMPEYTSPTVNYSSYVSPIAVNTTSNFDNYLKLLSGPEYNGYDYFGSNQMLGSGNNNPGSNTIIEENLKHVKHTSPFIPVDNFKPLVFSFTQKSSIYREVQELKKKERIVLYLSQPGFINIFDDPEPIPYQNIESTENFIGLNYKNEKVIKLRLKIDVVYNSLNDQGLNNTGTYIFTYIVDSNDVVVESSQLVPNLVSSNLNIGEFQEDLLLGTTHFAGQQVEGCLLVGSNYTCKAWNNATIEGNLTVANGYTVTVSGATEVNVLPESSISPEIVLQINSAFPFSEPMLEIDPSEVASFCNGTNPNLPPYMANVGNKSKFLDTNQVITETTIQEPKQPFSFSLFPNPTTQQTTVKVNGEYADQVSIVVYDIAGKEQHVAISGEGGRFNLDVAHLAKGLYLVKVSTFGESQTKQLVIN